LSPDALTIGFARRFATYKRANLVLADMELLASMVNDPKRPVQFVFAGESASPRHSRQASSAANRGIDAQ